MATKETKTETKETVKVLIPFVEGEDPEETVGINGVMTKIQKGKMVEVPVAVAQVLQWRDEQVMAFGEMKSELQNQQLSD